MRIGEAAERSGVRTKTIRYYEEIGVLAPPQRTPTGYRDYDESVLGRLAFVRSAQTVGLTLGEIREVIAFRERDEVPCAHVLGLLRHRTGEVSERIAELERTRTELQQLVDRAATLRPQDCPPATICHLVTSPRQP